MKRSVLRWAVLSSALVGTLAAAWHLSGENTDGGPVEAMDSRRIAGNSGSESQRPALGTGPTAAQRDDVIQLDRLDRRQLEIGSADPFKPLTWYVAPPPPPPPPPAAIERPRAPPFPFQFIGKYISTDPKAKPVFYLTRGTESYAVSVGDTLDDVYVLESFANGQLVFIYIPLHEQQALSIGSDQ